MSSHQNPYYYPDTGPIYYEGGSESSDPQQPHYPEESWHAVATTSDQSGHTQHQPIDPVRNILEAHDAEDGHYSNHPRPSYPPSSAPLGDPRIVTDTAYTHDDIIFRAFMALPFFYGHSQSDIGHDPSEPGCSYYNQPSVHDAHQMSGDFAGSFSVHHAQNIHTPSETLETPSAPVYPYLASTQLPSLEPVYQSDANATRPTPDGLMLDGFGTAGKELPNREYSHLSRVASSLPNQPGPSRLISSSPERKRLLPVSDADDHSTARRVAPRYDRASSVHSASSDSHTRRRSNPDITGRGPLIPQERYTTSSISAYNTPDRHLLINFDLENPDQIGISIADILHKADNFSRIRDPTHAFNHTGKKTFTLRVQWPGYKPWSKTIAALDWTTTRAPITRAKLAEAVATGVRDLMEKHRNDAYDPDYAAWNVGPDGIRFDQVCLVALHHVSKGSWQPELCLLELRR